MEIQTGSISIAGIESVKYCKLCNLVFVQGIATMNAAQLTFTLPYNAKESTYFNVSGLNAQQRPTANFEGFGNVVKGGKTATIYLSSANTYGAFNFVYYTDD